MPESRPQEIPGRTMLLLGGGATAAAGLVLGLTVLVGGRPGGSPPGGPDATVTTAQVGRAAGAVTVPPVAGLAVRSATDRLAERRLPVGAVIKVPSSRASGLVVRSYPEGGTPVTAGRQVTLYVSAGMGG